MGAIFTVLSRTWRPVDRRAEQNNADKDKVTMRPRAVFNRNERAFAFTNVVFLFADFVGA